ncbi:MAG: beta strand repeat-containing protein, partial [Acidimicrobiia bacterium]
PAASLTVSEAYDVEDRINHYVEPDILGQPFKGFAEIQDGKAFDTTTFGSLIQRGVDVVDAGGTVNVETGTYTELVTVNKSVTIDGEGAGPVPSVTLQSPSSGSTLINVTSTTPSDDITILDIAFDGTNGPNVADLGVNVPATANFDTLTVDRSTFTDLHFNGIQVLGDSVTGTSAQNVVISNSVFTNNGYNTGGAGDIDFFLYNQDASLSDLVLSNDGVLGARLGIQFRGVGAGTGVGVLPLGNVSLDDITITGKYRTQFIGFQRYTDVTTLDLNDVELGGATSEITGTFGALMRFDGVGSGTLASPATVDLGNTYFRGTAPSSAIKTDIEFAPDNTFAFLRADATNTSWDVGFSLNVPAASLTVSEAYDVEDRINHYVEPDILGQPFKGFAEIQDGKAFVTSTFGSLIQRAVDAVDDPGTVHIKTGTYTGSVSTAGKSVTLSPGGSAGQVTINGNITLDADDTLVIELDGTAPANYDNLTVNGTVDLGDATLSASRSFNPNVGTSFTIVDNDSTDAVTGTFASLPEGAVLSIDNIPFTVSYLGGTGNDITLTVVAPNTVWVNDTWVEFADFGGTPTVVEYSDTVDSDTGAGDANVTGKIFGYNAFDNLIDAITAVATGGTINILAGSVPYVEGPQVVINKDLVIIGQSNSVVTLSPGSSTSNSGDARGWFLVNPGINLDLSDVTLDGDGFNVYQAIRHKGTGTIDNVVFNDIQYNASGPDYSGVAIAAFGGVGSVDVTDSSFTDIGRIGVLYFGAGTTGTFSGNTYTGKGAGDWLDYAVEVGAGAVANITGNTITNNLGVASVDLSDSAGILVTTFFGSGTQATIENNFINGNTTAVAVGFDGTDTSSVTIFENDLSGNTN